MKKKKKVYDDDDGRVIAPMNVDGMPWYDRRQPKGTGQESETEFSYNDLSPEEKKAYRKETRGIIFGIMKYVIPIMFIFILGFFLVIWLMTL